MASSKAVELTKPRRMRRSVTYTDAVFQQLMEAHRNSTACLHATTGGAAATTTAVGGRRKAERSDLLTVKNFGSRTGLHWPEDRVAREIAGLISGFTSQQEETLTFLRKSGRAVVETTSSMEEFDGTGDPATYPFRSRQQIAAKLLDMFGYRSAKADVDIEYCKNREAPPPPSTATTAAPKLAKKTRICRDGGGKATLKPAQPSPADSKTTETIVSAAMASSTSDGAKKQKCSEQPTTAAAAINTETSAAGKSPSPAPAALAEATELISRVDDAQRRPDGAFSAEGRDYLASALAIAMDPMLGMESDPSDLAADQIGSPPSPLFPMFDELELLQQEPGWEQGPGVDPGAHPGANSAGAEPGAKPETVKRVPECSRECSREFSRDVFRFEIEPTGRTGVRLLPAVTGPDYCDDYSSMFLAPGLTGVPVLPALGDSEEGDGGDDSMILTSGLAGAPARSALSSPGDDNDSMCLTPAWLGSPGSSSPGGSAAMETGDASSDRPNFPISVSLEEQESLGLAFGQSLTPEEWLWGTSQMLDVSSIF